jgi:hypothetical protein
LNGLPTRSSSTTLQKRELAELYAPTPEEIKFAKSRVKSKNGLLGLMVMLKSFQRLGYFSHPELVPTAIIAHLRKRLNLSSSVSAIPSVRSIRYYQEAIRAYLKVKPYDKKAQQMVAITIARAVEVMEHPADLINVAIEELVKERYELPAFSTLDRLVGHVRSVTNTRLFQRVEAKLSPQKKADLERLLLPESPGSVAPLNLLKAPPKSATLSHIKELQAKERALDVVWRCSTVIIGDSSHQGETFCDAR